MPDFEKQSGHKVIVDNDTAGALKKRIEGGEAFDVAVITPGSRRRARECKGKIAGRQPRQSSQQWGWASW